MSSPCRSSAPWTRIAPRWLGADAFRPKPIDRDWLLASLDRLIRERPAEKLLIIDDDEVSRYLLRGLLATTRFGLLEASNVQEGMLLARQDKPRAIFLDLSMPGTDGFRVLELLKEDCQTHDIPVIIHTSKRSSEADRASLERAAAVLPKEAKSREAQLAAWQAALAAAGLATTKTETAS